MKNRFFFFLLVISVGFFPLYALAQDAAPIQPLDSSYFTPKSTGLEPGANPDAPPLDQSADLREGLVEYDENGQPIIQTPSVINQYSKRYKKKPVYGTDDSKKVSLIDTSRYQLYLARPDGTAPDGVIVRLVSKESITGCVKIDQPSVTQQAKGSILWLTIGDPVITVDSSVRYAHFQCKAGRQYAGADIILNRADLLAQGISQLAFRTKGGTDFYNLSLEGTTLQLEPKSSRSITPLYASNRPDPLVYDFSPAAQN